MMLHEPQGNVKPGSSGALWALSSASRAIVWNWLSRAPGSWFDSTAVQSDVFLETQTLLMLVCSTSQELYLVFLIPGMAFPHLMKESLFWFVVSLPQCALLVFRWGHMDNHQYLFAYWCLALAVARLGSDVDWRRSLVVNARLLIGLSMGCAVLWKVISPDYLDGSFFKYTLLTDTRFEQLSVWVGGMPPADLQENRREVAMLKTAYTRDDGVDTGFLRSNARIDRLALAITIWTILIEAVIAIAFLLSRPRWMLLCGHAALTVFIATTYVIATVLGFAWVLTLFGIAQCYEPRMRRWALAYICAFVFSCVIRIAFRGIVNISAD